MLEEGIVMPDDKIIIDEMEEPVKAPDDFTDPEELYAELVKSIQKYHPSTDLSQIEKAYKIAYDAHKEQVRNNGKVKRCTFKGK